MPPLPHRLLQRRNLCILAFPALKFQQALQGTGSHQRPGREVQKGSCRQCGSQTGLDWKAPGKEKLPPSIWALLLQLWQQLTHKALLGLCTVTCQSDGLDLTPSPSITKPPQRHPSKSVFSPSTTLLIPGTTLPQTRLHRLQRGPDRGKGASCHHPDDNPSSSRGAPTLPATNVCLFLSGLTYDWDRRNKVRLEHRHSPMAPHSPLQGQEVQSSHLACTALQGLTPGHLLASP